MLKLQNTHQIPIAISTNPSVPQTLPSPQPAQVNSDPDTENEEDSCPLTPQALPSQEPVQANPDSGAEAENEREEDEIKGLSNRAKSYGTNTRDYKANQNSTMFPALLKCYGHGLEGRQKMVQNNDKQDACLLSQEDRNTGRSQRAMTRQTDSSQFSPDDQT
ncbi:hypothetical protein K435DRAFT_800415 [Dendrothele bispora CBS 962.96]|uniref:Uncharacterized protein n=1 Tax=Dendrothele bispora (strain CBS 962.96) TaxID=1314807 RepID=A0A4S8LT68_DENBC|nr:hypothetical protein K435DRAFT_800415 [Dendrothele bispora CBS 962.96]